MYWAKESPSHAPLLLFVRLHPSSLPTVSVRASKASLFRTFITGLGLRGTENCLVFAFQNFIYLFFSEKEKFADAYQKRIFL